MIHNFCNRFKKYLVGFLLLLILIYRFAPEAAWGLVSDLSHAEAFVAFSSWGQVPIGDIITILQHPREDIGKIFNEIIAVLENKPKYLYKFCKGNMVGQL